MPVLNSVSTNVSDLCKTLDQLIDSEGEPYIRWALEGEHSAASIRSNSVNFFSGKVSKFQITMTIDKCSVA